MKLPFFFVILVSAFAALHGAEPGARPNILFILTDDLGYGDVGVFFQNARRAANDPTQPAHLTPHIDQMAAEGGQLRDHYCPAPVCAPSRASLLLGVHQGHANVRDNQFDKALEANHTLASVLKQAGYATACIGKWGLQGKPSADEPNGWPAHPMNRGFDEYFGYITHLNGHFHYPKEDKQPLLEGSKDVSAAYDCCYTTDLFTARAKKWITERQANHPDQPFFLYLAYDTPHAKLVYPPCPYPEGGGERGGVQWLGEPGKMINTATGVPDSYCHPDYASAVWKENSAAETKPWPDVYKRFATDVRRIDDCVGDLLQLLRDLHIDQNTLVIFTSDNGPSRESYLPENYEPTFFHSFGPFDGIKRDCWEGGIRVGALARWPGVIPPGRVVKEPSASWDWLPTFAAVAGIAPPARTDGVSLLPSLRGEGTQEPSRLYFEYFEGGRTPAYQEFVAAHRGRLRRQMQAVRLGDFIGVRYDIRNHSQPFEIYNIVTDPEQTKDLSALSEYGALEQQMKDTVLQVRRPDPEAKRPYDDELVPAIKKPDSLQAGIEWKLWTGSFPWTPNLDALVPTAAGGQASLDLPSALAPNTAAAALFTGYLMIPADGSYTFHLTANASGLLRIHEATVIDADFGYHPGTEVSGTIRLQAGLHPFRLYYRTTANSFAAPRLQWSSAGVEKGDVPASAFFCDSAATH
ncbi:MAG TPA: sulfatase-like hydrolase/transferase [Chthoniobacteraceae bacterium]